MKAMKNKQSSCSDNKFGNCHAQWRSQPHDLVPLCKYLQFVDCENNQFFKEMNNGNNLKFPLRDEIVGLAIIHDSCIRHKKY